MGAGAFRTGPRVKGVLDLKITKKHIFCWKWGSFQAAQVEKVESLGAAKAKMGEGLSHGTYPYCPNMGVPQPHNLQCINFNLIVYTQRQLSMAKITHLADDLVFNLRNFVGINVLIYIIIIEWNCVALFYSNVNEFEYQLSCLKWIAKLNALSCKEALYHHSSNTLLRTCEKEQYFFSITNIFISVSTKFEISCWRSRRKLGAQLFLVQFII